MLKESKVENLVRNIVLPLIEPAGYELVDVEYQKEGNHWVLRLFIDHEEGIDLDDCQWVSNLVGEELDKADPIPQAYLLEVSSPGIERPLKNAKDFDRFKGKKVEIKLFSPKNNQKEYVGILLGIENSQVALMAGQVKILFNMDEIAKAKLVFDFN
ncbi:ribosome maturation factor RimP [Candidatus Formimonas warabiya]|uniref:Ribosome maturation factor RimP n=1 Tax=Formimonas warabiya TaxID=1761012 RepID=A0A3G1KNZ4_FORW1|nr:ribosome maturation factor RimP [Candidatus Formimonas warabiya]ATW24201.1 ribosome maturation factor RimP [Candidatus Formimonas warabiya]